MVGIRPRSAGSEAADVGRAPDRVGCRALASAASSLQLAKSGRTRSVRIRRSIFSKRGADRLRFSGLAFGVRSGHERNSTVVARPPQAGRPLSRAQCGITLPKQLMCADAQPLTPAGLATLTITVPPWLPDTVHITCWLATFESGGMVVLSQPLVVQV